MATSKVFSLAAFVEYGNKCINNANNATPVMQDAFKKDLKKAIAHAGYPSKDEIGVVDEINDFELTNTLAQVPTLVSSFMRDEQRSFDLPAVDPNTCPASIKVGRNSTNPSTLALSESVSARSILPSITPLAIPEV